ncbi:hypothetical protein GCM10023201_29900 [Actinomycetospora corticicola]|uniref:DUF2029 domain-containing protein n=1 Tax=Actinomycetospora corticicola TaxID=663602 RepID=A0A7Y9J4W0_9PSEU|nr:hypothetical protein [Actinomycetospora corticicola]NYD35512.1 hypothetical protein [Actinomycetospora corticicola]
MRAGALALGAILAVVSTFPAMSLGGPPAVVGVYVVIVALVLAADVARPPRWVLGGLVAVVAVGLVVAFVLGPPSWTPGLGSDRADALDVALTRLAGGLYPYTGLTYLGNPITPLPGSLVLAAPFWALTGHAAWQNVAWTLVLLPVLNGGWRLRPAPTLLWALVAITPEVAREFLVGDDLVSSVVPAVAAAAWVLRARSPLFLTTGAVALGIATCTRPHLALVVVIVAVAVGLRPSRRGRKASLPASTDSNDAFLPQGWRAGLLVGGIAALTWAVLIVPFLLGGTDRFSPLHVGAKVTGERGLHPAIVGIAVLALALLVAALVRLRPTTESAVGWCAAAVLIAPTVLSAGFWLLLTSSVWQADLTLGAGAVPFAAWALARSRGEDPSALVTRGFPSRRRRVSA